MTSPNSIGNIMTRLGGLKNARPRRVMPGAEFLQELEPPESDVSGVASPLPNFGNFKSENRNLPETDLGGQLTPQSYDVRANTVLPPPQESEGFGSSLRKLGANLYNSFKEGWTPGVKPQTQAQDQEAVQAPESTPSYSQNYMHAGLVPPPSWTPAPQQSSGLGGALMDYINPTKNEQMNDYNKDLITQAQLRSQGRNPDQVLVEKHEKFKQDVQNAMNNPMQVGAYGATEEVANSPVLKAEFEKYTGTNFDDQVASEVSKYELAMQGIEDALNGNNTQLGEMEESIKQRILNNQSTDADKYYIGLALLMPLIVGGFFGKEAALGALGGGAQAIANLLSGKQKSIKEDEESLLDIGKQKSINQEKLANVAKEKATIEPLIRKNLPKDENSHLVGMDRAEYTDPNTGKKEEVFELLPGLVTKSKYVNTKKSLERMEKAADELSDTKTYVQQVNDLTSNVMDILTQLKDKPWWKKAHISSISAIVPGSLSALTDPVKWKGEMVPAGPLLENEIGILANQYAHAQDLGQLDRAAQAHMEKLVGNPTKSLLTPKDVETQVMNIRKFIQDELVKKTKNKGFIPEFIINEMNEANEPVHGKLNQRQQDNRTKEIEKKLAQEETNYAQ